MKFFLKIGGPFLFICLLSCNNAYEKGKKEKDPQQVKQTLMDANKILDQKESDEIDAYAKQHNWAVQQTGTGLRYWIYKKGNGELAKTGQWAKVHYKISLLDGTVCYSSEGKEPVEFLIGQDHVESGLHEGITYLCTGDRAKIILPSYLAHGLLGDQDRIPPRSVVIYDIELLGLR
jgi:FKBP-type peptidyl-prolyl cis-trans isomerase